MVTEESVKLYDLCVIGAGVAGLNAAFVASLYLKPDARVLIIDKHAEPGGMWNDAYSYVRLHQPYRLFTAGTIPWELKREASYLADRQEVMTHLAHCLDVISQKFSLDARWGFAYRGHREDDSQVSITASDASGATHVFEARQLIDARGFDVEVNDPLSLSSTRVNTTTPHLVSGAGLASLKADEPVWIIGSGKTAMDTARFLLAGNPDRQVNMVAGTGTYFLDRDTLYLRGARRWWSGMRPNSCFTEIARRYDGTNIEEVTAWFTERGATAPIDPASRCLFGLLSQEETAVIKAGLNATLHDHFVDVIDTAAGPVMELRSGAQQPLEPGSWVVNCTGHFGPRDTAHEPYVSPGGMVLSINSTSTVLGFTTFSAYFLSHLFFLGKLRDAPLYEADFYGLRRAAPEASVAVMSSLIMYNLSVIFENVPLKVFQANGLDLDRWYPAPRRLLGQLKFMATHKRDRPHHRNALDTFSQTSGVRCGELARSR